MIRVHPMRLISALAAVMTAPISKHGNQKRLIMKNGRRVRSSRSTKYVNPIGKNLYGFSAKTVTENQRRIREHIAAGKPMKTCPVDIVAQLRKSKGSQAVHRERRQAERLAAAALAAR